MSHSRIRIIGAGNVRIVRHVRTGMLVGTIEPATQGYLSVINATGRVATIVATMAAATEYAELRWGMPYTMELGGKWGDCNILNEATGNVVGTVKQCLDRDHLYEVYDADGTMLAGKHSLGDVEYFIEQHWNGTDRYERSARIRAYERGEITGATL